MLSLKCGNTFLRESSILFSTVNLKLGLKTFQFIYRSKIWILKCWSWAAYTSIHERDGKLGFLNCLVYISKFFLIH